MTHDIHQHRRPLDLHLLTPGRRPTIALVVFRSDYRVAVRYYLDRRDLIQSAAEEARDMARSQGLPFNRLGPIETPAQAAKYAAAPCRFWQLITTAADLDRIVDSLAAYTENLLDALADVDATCNLAPDGDTAAV